VSQLSIPFENSYAKLPERFYARLPPSAVRAPRLIRVNVPLAETLGLDPVALASEDAAQVFAGNDVPEGADPLAMAYAGHQFGGWVPQLGDGRAILLGEVVGKDGIRRDIQLKGSGRTPFSRGGDGRAQLGPILREYIISEQMYALGIPTTRALAAVTTGEEVLREGLMPGAVLTRVAESHIRVGTFQFFAARDDTDALQTLCDYVIDRHYPANRNAENPAAALLGAVVERQATLVAKWFSVGFIHGVMNTDNTSIVGETIDYGPCAFMDIYDPNKVFSSIDHMGRYAFSNQPAILQWNLAQLAQALLPLMADDTKAALPLAQAIIDTFPTKFETALAGELRAKLGLKIEAEGDLVLAMDLLERMATNEADFTLTFRRLARALGEATDDAPLPSAQFKQPSAFDEWAVGWRERLAAENAPDSDIRARLLAANPAVIARNHLVESAIRAAEDEGDFKPFNDLLAVIVNPYDDLPENSPYTIPPEPHEVVHQTFCGT
jgi:uncharacterized protein YdiU (UPF0061 family)